MKERQKKKKKKQKKKKNYCQREIEHGKNTTLKIKKIKSKEK